MKIELNYFEGCPTYRQTKKDLERILKERNLNVKVEMIEIKTEKDAENLKFIGSPTVKINGKDVDSSAVKSKNFGLRCRVYFYKGKISASPPEEMINRALEEAAR